MLVPGKFAQDLLSHIEDKNNSVIEKENIKQAIIDYCNKLEELIDERIKSIQITIPPGGIVVAGSPTTQTNVVPIIISTTNIIPALIE